MKKIIMFLILLTAAINLEAITVVAPKAPPTIPILKAVEKTKGFDVKYYTAVNTEVIPRIIKGEEYLYILPTNIAAKLSSKGSDIRLLSVLSSGLLSIVGNEELESIKNMDGKIVYIGAQGSSPDVISRYIFSKHKINPRIVYRSSSEIFKLAISKKIDFAVLPEPLATMAILKNNSLKRIFILKDEWEDINGTGGIPQVGLFASGKFIEKEKLEIEKFLGNLESSVSWTNEETSEAAKFGIEKMGLNFTQTALEISIPYMNLIYRGATDSKEGLTKYFEALIEMDEKILEQLPEGEFYENEIN